MALLLTVHWKHKIVNMPQLFDTPGWSTANIYNQTKWRHNWMRIIKRNCSLHQMVFCLTGIMNDKLITTRYLHLHLSEHSAVAASHLMSPAVPLAAQDTHTHVTLSIWPALAGWWPLASVCARTMATPRNTGTGHCNSAAHLTSVPGCSSPCRHQPGSSPWRTR